MEKLRLYIQFAKGDKKISYLITEVFTWFKLLRSKEITCIIYWENKKNTRALVIWNK